MLWMNSLLVVVRLVGFLEPDRDRVKVKAAVLFDESLEVRGNLTNSQPGHSTPPELRELLQRGHGTGACPKASFGEGL